MSATLQRPSVGLHRQDFAEHVTFNLRRPRKPTPSEARAEALDALVPAAVKSLAAHLGDGDPAAWRAALRWFELCYGRPAETVAMDSTPGLVDVREMTAEERAVLLRRVLDDHPHLVELIPERLRPDGSPTPGRAQRRQGLRGGVYVLHTTRMG